MVPSRTNGTSDTQVVKVTVVGPPRSSEGRQVVPERRDVHGPPQTDTRPPLERPRPV